VRGVVCWEFDQSSRIPDRETDPVVQGVVGERAARKYDGVVLVVLCHGEP